MIGTRTGTKLRSRLAHIGLWWGLSLIGVLLTPGWAHAQGTAHSSAQKVNAQADADQLFQEGKFADAQAADANLWKSDSANVAAATRLGAIALFSNHLAEAQTWLNKALALKPGDRRALSLLAESDYRQDDFAHAAMLEKELGRDARAANLAGFQSAIPYQIQSDAKSAVLPFLKDAPPEVGDLPVVEVRVNGGRIARFLIDTGGPEVFLDAAYAQEIHATSVSGNETGTFAGGKTAGLTEGRIDSLTLGGFQVENVPVQIVDLSAEHIDGILGTVLFYHFLTTLDYPNRQLILRRDLNAPTSMTRNAIAVPFWMAGDHYMVAWGTLNKTVPHLFFIDTGLAGGGFTGPQSILDEAGITPDVSEAGTGRGVGGKVTATPFTIDRLTLGQAARSNIRGLFLGPFPVEDAFGFHIGGLVSHNFFQPYALTFDFRKMRLLLQPAAGRP